MTGRLKLGVWMALALLACSRDIATGGRQPAREDTPVGGALGDNTFGSPAPGNGSPSIGTAGAIAVSDNALNVHVEDIRKMTVQIITLACAGECADIAAVAQGGNPPYTFAWDDGTTAAQRHVCLAASAQLRVNVTDTAISAVEFAYRAQTASADVRAEVLNCSDAGVPPGGGLCIQNPSLEGTASIGLGSPDSVPSGWTVCANTPDTGPSLAKVPASDGATYLGLCTFTDQPEVAGGAFCAPLQAGQPISFSVDLTSSSTYGTSPSALQLWGGSTSCSKDELLWTSPVISEVDSWKTHCGTLTPTKSFPFLVLTPLVMNSFTSYLLVDNFRPRLSCP